MTMWEALKSPFRGRLAQLKDAVDFNRLPTSPVRNAAKVTSTCGNASSASLCSASIDHRSLNLPFYGGDVKAQLSHVPAIVVLISGVREQFGEWVPVSSASSAIALSGSKRGAIRCRQSGDGFGIEASFQRGSGTPLSSA